MRDGFLKVMAATPDIRVADCDFNAENISGRLGRRRVRARNFWYCRNFA